MSKKSEKFLKARVHPLAFEHNLLSTMETIEFMEMYKNEQLMLNGVVSTCCDDKNIALKNKIRLDDLDRYTK